MNTLIALLSCAPISALVQAAPQDPPLGVTTIALPGDGARLALRDLDGDGALELLRFDTKGVAVRALGAEGVYDDAEALLEWPSQRVAWDLVDLDSDGRVELVTVTDGRRVETRTWSRAPADAPPGTAGTWAAPVLVLEELCYLPYGVARVGLARDVDGDGRADLVLPGAGVFRIRRNLGPAEDGSKGALRLDAPIDVAFEPEVQLQLGDPKRLSARFGQTVRVPWFRIEDVDGDGLLDLVSETTDEVAFHLARPTIETQPTWTLDLAELRGTDQSSSVDLDDILASVSGTVQWRVEDLDGVAPRDLVIGSKGTFKVYLGGAATGPRAEADQVLKASGNVLYFFLRNALGDERPDLQVLRGERISLARLLRFLVLPGRLDFELFTYENTGGTFDRKPTQRSVLGLRVPRLLGFIDQLETLGADLEAKWEIPARRVDWDGDGAFDDVVDVRPSDNGFELVVVRNCAPTRHRWEDLPIFDIDALVERILLADLDRAGDGGESVIDLGELDKFALSPSAALRDLALPISPIVRIPLPFGPLDWALNTLDINGDGRDDIVIAGRVMELRDSGGKLQFVQGDAWNVQIFVRR